MDTPNRPDLRTPRAVSSPGSWRAVRGKIASISRSHRFVIGLTLVAVTVFGGTALYLHRQQSRALAAQAIDAHFTPDGRLRPLAEIRAALRSMKLVTTELRGEASSAFESRIWRGNASATVAAPVVYHYGVDLSRLDVLHLGTAWLPGVYVVTVPEPERIAVEVDIDHRREDVNVSGLRLRSRVGEYLLGRARVGVQSQARLAALAPEQAARVREDATRQVAALVSQVVGSSARVEVRFSGTADGGDGAAHADAAAMPPPLDARPGPNSAAEAGGGAPNHEAAAGNGVPNHESTAGSGARHALIARMGRSQP